MEKITSTEDYLGRIFEIKPAEDEELFYRSHSKDTFRLLPYILRKRRLIKTEHLMFKELLSTNPDDFTSDKTTLEKLVRMAHHSLPTRLLDTTSNPLVALFFACYDYPKYTGEVIVFKVKKTDVKFFDSDTVSCLSNLAQLSYEYKKAIPWRLGETEFNNSQPIKRLHHFIKEEKPFFQPLIRPSDLGRVLCIKPKLSNKRIVAQAGAFIIFGMTDGMDNKEIPGFTIERISVDSSCKKAISDQLDRLSIGDNTLFPGIESSADYITDKYE
jgi:hypothetical protein